RSLSCASVRLFSLFLLVRRLPRAALFPYTTLFRSRARAALDPRLVAVSRAGGRDGAAAPRPQGDPGCHVVPLGVRALGVHRGARSEEHTSELQSRENLVCRLLLEKKNKGLQ